MKTCIKCKEAKELSNFTVDRRAVSGLSSLCKLCTREKSRLYSLKSKDIRKTYNASYREANRKRLNDYDKARRRANPEIHRQRLLAWQKKNPDKVKAQEARYAIKHRTQILARGLAWNKANPDKVRARSDAWYVANRERHLANCRAYAKANPEKVLASVRRHTARKFNQMCTCCQTPDAKINFTLVYALARRLKMHVDHVRPLAKGGKHCLHNLQLLTPIDNMRKGAKWLEAA